MSEQGTMTIAVAGNPNSGKTTVFNALTGSRQRIGNWPGVTVEKKEGTFIAAGVHKSSDESSLGAGSHSAGTATATVERDGENPRTAYRVVDLPGIYSIAASSEDEAVARDYLLSTEADLVVDVVDASNLQRNLFLTVQLIELGIPVIVVLNMMDMAAKKGMTIDVEDLSRHLGCPVIPTTAIHKDEVESLRAAIHERAGSLRRSSLRIAYSEEVEAEIGALEKPVASLAALTKSTPRWLALQLLEGDPWVTKRVQETSAMSHDEIVAVRDRLSQRIGEELDVALADSRYGFIHGLSRHISRKKLTRSSWTERIDNVVMNRFLAIPVFLAVMYAVFWVTISVGGAFIDFFDILFGTVFVDGFGTLLANLGAPQWLIGILAGGIGAGIQTVATFVPIIFMMFLALSVLEDSGYMGRAAYVMDRFMRSIGLPGKSFVPMLVGFGCTVPAIMGTRTLDSRRDRFTTIFMSPFMSCGARLPVYALFGAAFFPSRSGLIVLSLYVIGIVLAVLTGLLLKLTVFRGEPSHFIMELPPYHAPRVRFVLLQAWRRLRLFVVRAGIIITTIVAILSFLNTLGTDGSVGNDDTSDSVLAAIGQTLTPVFVPMGIEPENWPATVGIFTGLFAKEAVVGTLSSLYSQEAGGGEETAFSLAGGLREAVVTIPENLAGVFGALGDPLGTSVVGEDAEALADDVGADVTIFSRLRDRFNATSAYAYLLFVLIYFPCVAAFAAAIREMGAGLGWLLAGYTTILAWSVATLFYQLVTGPQLVFVILPVTLLVLLVGVFAVLGRTSSARSRLEQVG